jgi:hypothetical protein
MGRQGGELFDINPLEKEASLWGDLEPSNGVQSVMRLMIWLLLASFHLSLPATAGAAQLRTDHLDIKYTGISENQAKEFSDRAEAALEFVQALFEREYKRRIMIVVEDKRGIPRANGRQSRITIPADRIRGDAGGAPRVRGLGPAIAHEITHLVAKSRGCRNRYLDEGLAVYVQERFGERAYPNMGHDVHEETKRYSQKIGDLIPVSDLEKVRKGGDTGRRTLAYLQEGSFVRYLIERDGLPRFMSLYSCGTYLAVYGKSFSEVEQDWKRFMTSVEAKSFDETAPPKTRRRSN